MIERYLEEENESGFSLITDYDGSDEHAFDIEVNSGEVVPVLPLRNMVLFPGVFLPVNIGRNSSLKLVREAEKKQKPVAVVCQKDANVEEPKIDDLHAVGTIGRIVRVLEMPDQTTTVILQGMKRLKLKSITQEHPYLKGEIEILKEELPGKRDKEFQALVESCKEMTLRYIKSSDMMRMDSTFAIKNISNPLFLINFICANMPFKKDDKVELLTIGSLRQRTYRLLEILGKEVQMAEIKASIQMRAREDMDQQQREYFLQQQIKTIQNELGGSGQEQEIEEMRQKAEKTRWSDDTKEIFLKELAKLERTHPQSPDYSVQLNYLQTMLSLPWGIFTTDNLNLKNAERILNKDHYGLEKVKERILEHLAVLKLKGDMKSPIICLYGPPGVGKTSLGKSIAAALKRKYIRMSLGGVHDEAEIRGHRKTYIGAMPGRIAKGLIKAGSSNPVFVLDEIDKVGGHTHEGDPSSALLEVLDPEQNSTFHDNFLDVDYDLSKVLFIATANNLNTIPAPLLDRMELIEMSGYITEEKIEIARKHLVPKELEANGLKKGQVKLPKETLEAVVESYTRESGVRELEKKIGKILRKSAKQYATDGYLEKSDIRPADLHDFLGVAEYSRDKYQGNEYAGVVTGLAWTAVGGEILFVETSLSRGKGNLTLTGNLGDVMKESAMLALEYIKAHASLLGLDEEVFERWNIHVHVPEGAIPKDGPSAGVTMATALASAFTQRKVKAQLAMTGEITLRGKVLPVGGIKEKILAAKRAGIKEIVMCADNRKDIDEIPDMYLKGIEFHYVNDIKEVLAIALTDEKVTDAIDLTAKKQSKE
ncbi:MAG: endopeptidase La [Mediterranea sp.]|jgi:ATP-dependent Lon protease|nr:endopeptidase La [Mediterranea sp.]